MHQEHVAVAKELQQRTGPMFYLASRFLPPRIRDETHVLYAFFRTADEVVDDPGGLSPAEQASRLDHLRAEAVGDRDPTDPVMVAFQKLTKQADLPTAEIDAFIESMKADIDTHRYETYAELEEYMRGSAAAVGVLMTAVMEPDEWEAAIPHAITLGKALQMTNFLRDVREDIRKRNRVYLPQETLREHGATIKEVEALEPTDGVRRAIAAELERTETLYREGVAGIRYLPKDCQFPVLLAAVLSAEHHRLIRAQEYDVLTARPSLSTPRRTLRLLQTRLHWLWNRDPTVVFRRVAAIPDGNRDSTEAIRDSSGVPTR